MIHCFGLGRLGELFPEAPRQRVMRPFGIPLLRRILRRVGGRGCAFLPGVNPAGRRRDSLFLVGAFWGKQFPENSPPKKARRTACKIKSGDMRGGFAIFFCRQIPFAGRKISSLQQFATGVFLGKLKQIVVGGGGKAQNPLDSAVLPLGKTATAQIENLGRGTWRGSELPRPPIGRGSAHGVDGDGELGDAQGGVAEGRELDDSGGSLRGGRHRHAAGARAVHGPFHWRGLCQHLDAGAPLPNAVSRSPSTTAFIGSSRSSAQFQFSSVVTCQSPLSSCASPPSAGRPSAAGRTPPRRTGGTSG